MGVEHRRELNFYNKEAGTKARATDTGAGQWGSALAMACKFFDIDLEVWPGQPELSRSTFGSRNAFTTLGSKCWPAWDRM